MTTTMEESPKPEKPETETTPPQKTEERYSPLPLIYTEPKSHNVALPKLPSTSFAAFNLKDADKPHTYWSYYWMAFRHFGESVVRAIGKDFLIALALGTFTFLVSWLVGETNAFRAFLIALISLSGLLGIFAFKHSLHTPFLIHQSKETERSARKLHWIYGVIGVFVPLAIVAGFVSLGLWAYATRQMPSAPPLKIPSSDAGAKDAEMLQLQQRIKELTPDEKSLKIRLLNMADAIEVFGRERQKHYPTCTQTSQMTPEQQRTAMMPCAKYSNESEGIYAEKFASHVLEMIAEFKAKGGDVYNIEGCAASAACGISIPVQLRAFSEQLTVQDELKR